MKNADWLHARIEVRWFQVFDLQRDAMQVAGVDPAHVYQDQASGRRDDRPGLVSALRARLGSQKRPKGIDRPRCRYRLVFGIFAALAEFERELISERTRAGLASAQSISCQSFGPTSVVTPGGDIPNMPTQGADERLSAPSNPLNGDHHCFFSRIGLADID